MILLFVRSFLIICVNKVAHLVCHDIVLLFIRFLVVSVEWTTMRTVRHARLGVTSITQRQLSHEWSLAAGWSLTVFSVRRTRFSPFFLVPEFLVSRQWRPNHDNQPIQGANPMEKCIERHDMSLTRRNPAEGAFRTQKPRKSGHSDRCNQQNNPLDQSNIKFDD